MGRVQPLLFLLIVVLAVLAGLGDAVAQGQPQRLTAVRESDVDADFAWQGEFLGWSRGACGDQAWGLQVVALGDGRFSASLYQGGLPGQGARLGTRRELRGQRDGHRLDMVLESRRFEVAPDEVRVFHQNGRYLGRLERQFRSSPTMAARPPRGAHVLFRSASDQQFPQARLTEEGWLLSGVTTPQPVEDFVLHLEFRTPYMPYARGQARGNSGVYIQRRYEVQILDSFGLAPEANGCGGLYRLEKPALNMCLPPLSWQTYDIHFRAARFDEAGNKRSPAHVTVYHNGVAIHYQRAIASKTGAGQPEGSHPLPIYLQDHGNPVMFRNIWLVTGMSGDAVPRMTCPPPVRRWGPWRRFLLGRRR